MRKYLKRIKDTIELPGIAFLAMLQDMSEKYEDYSYEDRRQGEIPKRDGHESLQR